MKRRIFALTSLLILMLTMTAHAIEPRVAGQMPILSFNGTTAVCFASCKGSSSTDEVEATLTLYQGKTYVDSWSASGTGRISVSGDCSVISGKSYTLTLAYSINGTEKPSVSTTATCP